MGGLGGLGGAVGMAHLVGERGELRLGGGEAVGRRAVRRDGKHERERQLARAQDVGHLERDEAPKGVAEEGEWAGRERVQRVGNSVGIGRHGLEGRLGGARATGRRMHDPQLDRVGERRRPQLEGRRVAARVREADEAELDRGLAVLGAAKQGRHLEDSLAVSSILRSVNRTRRPHPCVARAGLS